MDRARITPIAASVLCASAGVLLWARTAPALVAPAVCPGLMEMLGAAAARTWPNAILTNPFLVIHLIAAIAAIAAVSIAIARITGSTMAACAVAIAWSAGAMWLPSLGSLDSILVAVAALTWLGLSRATRAQRPLGSAVGHESAASATMWPLVGLIAAAAIAPVLAIPSALTVIALLSPSSGTSRSRAWIRTALWTIAVVAVPLAVTLGMPGLPDMSGARSTLACIVPSAMLGTASVTTSAHNTSSAIELAALAGITPVVLVLIVLGGVDRLAGASMRCVAVAAVWCASTAVVMFETHAVTVRTAAPITAALWLVAGLGFAAVIAQAQRARWPRVAAAAATIALTLLIVSPRLPGAASIERVRPLGHDGISNSDVRRLVGLLPRGSAIVVEDAMVDLHLRALASRKQRAGSDARVVTANASAVLAAISSRRTFAWPWAETTLQFQGVRFTEPGLTFGLAEVAGGGACTPMTSAWQSMPPLAGARAITLIADASTGHGPIIVWLHGVGAIDAIPDEWSASARRGFNRVVYDSSKDAADITQQRTADGAPMMTMAGGFLTRIEMWRTPEAPSSLTVKLTAPPIDAIAKLTPESSGPVRLCPSFLSPITSIQHAR